MAGNFPLEGAFVGPDQPSGSRLGSHAADGATDVIYASHGTLGNLNIKGDLEIDRKGHLFAGQTAYDTGTGFWLEADPTPKFSLGNSGANKITWDGTTLAVTGTLTATVGNIGGWTIGANTLTGAGTNALVLTSGPTTGSIRSGQTAYDTGTGFYIEANNGGAGSPRFSIGNSAGDKLTWDGSTMSVTGRLNFGTGDYIDNDRVHFDITDSVTATIEGYPTGWIASEPYAQIAMSGRRGGSDYALMQMQGLDTGNTSYASVDVSGTASANGAYSLLSAFTTLGAYARVIVAGDMSIQGEVASNIAFRIVSTNRALSLYGRLYLGSGSASQSTRYLVDDGTRSEFFGGNLRFAAPAGLVIPTKAGTPGDADFTDDVNGQIALDTTNNLLYFRSTTWQAIAGGVTGLGAVGGQIDIGDSASNGANTTASRSDHQHAFPAPSAGYPVDVSGSEADGSASTPARSDHQHKLGILTTKGDVLTYSTLPARLAVGANGQHLAADSSQTEGIVWVAAQQAGNDFLTISGGVITLSALPGAGNLLVVDTEAAAATDDLDTITVSTGWPTGGYVTVVAQNSARTVVMKDGTGNLGLAGDFSLTHADDTITLVWNGNTTKWLEVARSDNAA